MKDISPCGANCTDCAYLPMCKGCNAVNGVVFYCEGNECPVHACSRKKGIGNCGKCAEVPCAKYLRMRDPKMTDEQFQESVDRRIQTLKVLNSGTY